MTQPSDSPSESAYVPTHMYSTLSPLHKYFTCFTTFHLCPFVQACVPDHWSSLWLGTHALLQAVAGLSEGHLK